MSYDLGGFSVTASTSRVMLIIFAVYSVVIVGFGFYIKYQSKKGGKDGLASFLTGGGGLGAGPDPAQCVGLVPAQRADRSALLCGPAPKAG